MYEWILLTLFLPFLIAIVSLFQKNMKILQFLNNGSSILVAALIAYIVQQIINAGAFYAGFLYLDELSAIMLMVIAFLSTSAVLVSHSYMERELSEGHITPVMYSRYYALLQIFIFTMLAVAMVENLGLLWVAIEATTLASALLVAFYFNRSALEAAWKYVMVCTVGICLALLGTILLYYAQVNATGNGENALSWQVLMTIRNSLDPALVKLAFIFVIIGYGTKAGLAPMHTWLPDAHSQAPAPISGLLSGALLSCALYAIMRNWIIVKAVGDAVFFQDLLIALGCFSIAIAVPFILIQHDIKRLFAYSSVEHIGIIALGIGVGSHWAIYGALLHIFNHAIVKSSLFYLVGIITQSYQTKQIIRIRGIMRTMPVVGFLFLLGVLAITGIPPFNLFMSKFIIIAAGYTSGKIFLSTLVLLLLAGVCIGMMYYCLQMVFRSNGSKGPRIYVKDKYSLTVVTMSMVTALVTGVYLPQWFDKLLHLAANVVGG